ncbi:MAG: hypothetical protein NT159_21940 [Proteobacteria bacterium]|nr:hypothetical protein [Pseudomonadota bacterium]
MPTVILAITGLAGLMLNPALPETIAPSTDVVAVMLVAPAEDRLAASI